MSLDPRLFAAHSRRALDEARAAYIGGAIDLEEMEHRVELALVIEDPERPVPAHWSVEPAFVREVVKLWDPAYVRHA